MAVDSVTSSPQAKALQFIEDVTRDVDSVQRRVLGEILSQNSDTEYLSRVGLGSSTDRTAFKSKVPVVSCDDIWPDIERIANGDKSNILCSRPISEFFTNTGTSSGESKLIPTSHEEMERRWLCLKLAVSVVNQHVPGVEKGKGLYFFFTNAERKTPGGHVAQLLSTSIFKSEQFKEYYSTEKVYTSPIEAILCLDTFQSMYTHMLCGLIMRRDITRIGASFASGFLRAIGKDYEIVVTTYAGLWRYRVGDILRVTGFHNKAPQFSFLRRKNALLCIDADVTDEAELHAAIQNASALLKEFDTSVVEYTSYADTKAFPGHYVIYWEPLIRDLMRPPSHELLEKCCLTVEESLSSVYRQYRAAERMIGPLEIRVLKNGTFEELIDYAISRGASITQYKVPRCVNSEPILQLLDARVVSAHFSPAAPHWSPEPRR